MAYSARDPASLTTIEDLKLFLAEELARIEESLQEVEHVQLVEMHVEPEKPRDGVIVLADGTNWDPGSGAGFYGWQNGSWKFLG